MTTIIKKDKDGNRVVPKGSDIHEPTGKSYDDIMKNMKVSTAEIATHNGKQVYSKTQYNPYTESYGDGVTPMDSFRNKDYAQISRNVAQKMLGGIQLNGTAALHEEKKKKSIGESLTKIQLYGGPDPEEDFPIGPGFAYMTHLFKHNKGSEGIKEMKKAQLTNGSANIITNAMDGVKTALKMIGVFSETNTGGLPMDLKSAMSAFYGGKEVDDVQKSQFMHEVQDGVHKIDKKKIRKFVNQDGSLTWEVLNDDKSVMSRFTFGDYKGTKIFAQGGYNAFAELLNKARKELGPDDAGEFEAIRNNFKR